MREPREIILEMCKISLKSIPTRQSMANNKRNKAEKAIEIEKKARESAKIKRMRTKKAI